MGSRAVVVEIDSHTSRASRNASPTNLPLDILQRLFRQLYIQVRISRVSHPVYNWPNRSSHAALEISL
jgi:hypothetical protein